MDDVQVMVSRDGVVLELFKGSLINIRKNKTGIPFLVVFVIFKSLSDYPNEFTS
jgi:hypothetical protein